MLMFAKDKAHMSGYVVIMFYILILADIGLFIKTFHANNELTGWLNAFFGIGALICAVGLIILLNSYKIGGYIALIGSIIQFICGAFMTTTMFKGDKWEGLIVLMLLHVISVFIVLFGSRNYNLN